MVYDMESPALMINAFTLLLPAVQFGKYGSAFTLEELGVVRALPFGMVIALEYLWNNTGNRGLPVKRRCPEVPQSFIRILCDRMDREGKRPLWCKGWEYDLRAGDLVLFHSRDNHFCAPVDEEPLDCRVLNIRPEVLLSAAKESVDFECAPRFTHNVVL